MGVEPQGPRMSVRMDPSFFPLVVAVYYLVKQLASICRDTGKATSYDYNGLSG